MVSDNVNCSCRAFKIMAPGPKGLVDSEEFLVMSVIVELQSGESLGIVGDRSNLLIRTTNGENASNGIVRSICLYNDGSIYYRTQWVRIGVEVKVSLRFWKAEQQESLKFQGIPLWVRQVKGVTIPE